MSPSNSSVGIVGVGAAVPRGRLPLAEVVAGWGQRGGRGTLAICGPDEDCLTLAWSAADAALGATGVRAADLDALYWGTARPPMAEGPSHAFLNAAVGLGTTAAGFLTSGSVHAGLDALVAAWDAVAAGSVGLALVIASDALVPGPGTGAEKATGAGAVALVLSGAGDAPALLVRRATRVRPLLDRYRGDGQAGTGDPYDPRLYRERELLPSVASAVQALGELPPETRYSLPDPDGRLGKAVAGAVRAKHLASEGIFSEIGEAGSAAPFLGLLSALGTPGPACVVGTGGGRSTAVVLEVADAVPGALAARAAVTQSETRPLTYASVLRSRGQLVPLSDPVAMGVPPGSAAFVRGADELLGLEGRRCEICATVSVPPSIHPVCVNCGAPGGEIIHLARTGSVQTFVVNHTMPPPFEAPLPITVVDLDDGSRVMLQGMPEDASALDIGDRVHLELRRYALERGVPVYGFKVRRDGPASGAASSNGANGSLSVAGKES